MSINLNRVLLLSTLHINNIYLVNYKIEHCDRCQRNSKESKKQGHDVLHPIPVRAQPWYMVGIDLIDAHKITENGNR